MNKFLLPLLLLVFLADKVLQFLNRLPSFLCSYLDDFLLIPLLMGFGLFIQQKWVNPNFRFNLVQILAVWVFFSLAFELIAPKLTSSYIADWVDILVYGLGALFFGFFQNQAETKPRV